MPHESDTEIWDAITLMADAVNDLANKSALFDWTADEKHSLMIAERELRSVAGEIWARWNPEEAKL